jgi:hypothetical protein
MATIFINSPRIDTQMNDPESLTKLDTIHVSLQNQGQSNNKLNFKNRIIRLQKMRKNHFETTDKKQEELDLLFQQIQMENELHKGMKSNEENLSNCPTVSPIQQHQEFQSIHDYNGQQRKQMIKRMANKLMEEYMIKEIMIKN